MFLLEIDLGMVHMQRSKHKNKNEMKQISKDAQSRP